LLLIRYGYMYKLYGLTSSFWKLSLVFIPAMTLSW